MSFEVLVVCTANACRSVVAEDLLRANAHGPLSTLRVSSAGTHVTPPARRCVRAADWVLAHSGRRLTPSAPRPLDPLAVDRADLLLTLDRVHRGAVIRLRPLARTRTFTLAEACLLADALRPAEEPSGFPEAVPSDAIDASLRQVVAGLDAARGTLGLVPGADLDILDAHEQRAPHSVVLPEVSDRVELLCRALIRLSALSLRP